MLNCPNKRLKSWKDLVSNVGENKAYLLWAEYNGSIPEQYYQKSEQPVSDSVNYSVDLNSVYPADAAFEKSTNPDLGVSNFSFMGIPIIESPVEDQTVSQDNPVKYDRIKEVLYINREALMSLYESKEWVKPRILSETIDGEVVYSETQPIPIDSCKNYNEFEEFAIEREYQHSLLTRAQFEGIDIVDPNSVELYPGVFANQGQAAALNKFKEFIGVSGERTFLLKGRGGTGKSTIAGKMMTDAIKAGYQIYATAISDQATTNLGDLSSNYKTLSKNLQIFNFASMFGLVPEFNQKGELIDYRIPDAGDERGAGPKIKNSPKTVLFFDEASMVGTKELLVLKKIIPDAKIVFMGDNAQINPIVSIDSIYVDDYNNISKVFRQSAIIAELTEVMRQASENPVLFAANNLAEEIDKIDYPVDGKKGETPNFVKHLFTSYNPEQNTGLITTNNIDDFLNGAIEDFRKYGNKETLVIVGTNEKVSDFNKRIRSAFFTKDDKIFEDGERLMTYSKYTKYNGKDTPKTEIFNSSIVTVVESKPVVFNGLDLYSAIIEYTENDGSKNTTEAKLIHRTDTKKYQQYQQKLREAQAVAKKFNYKNREANQAVNEMRQVVIVDYAYAMTAHKVQGQTVRNSYVYGNFGGGFELEQVQRMFYTGLTRASNKSVVYSTADESIKNKNKSKFDKFKKDYISEKASTVPHMFNLSMGEYEAEVDRRALNAVQKRKQERKELSKSKIVGFYDGEKIIINKDNPIFMKDGIGTLVHEHVHPLLSDLDQIVSGEFAGEEMTDDDIERAILVKQNLLTEAIEILEKNNINVEELLNSPFYSKLVEDEKDNELIARAVEISANQQTKDKKSFIKAMQDFITFMFKHIKSRFYKALIFERSITAKDLEPIIGIHQLAAMYIYSGSAKRTTDSSGNLRNATGTKTNFDAAFEKIGDPDNIIEIINNSSLEEFSTMYDYNKYNQVFKHEKPELVEKSFNNTIFENILVDAANKVAELEASGITPDTLNIYTAMSLHGFDANAITTLLNNPMLKEYYYRLQAKKLMDGYSVDNDLAVLEDMKKEYIPNSFIKIDLDPKSFYDIKNGKIVPKYTIKSSNLFDVKAIHLNSDKKTLSTQNFEVLENQFQALLNTISFQNQSKDLIGLTNLLNLNSNGGTKSFVHDDRLEDQINTLRETNVFENKYDLGNAVKDSFLEQVFDNFSEIRQLLKVPGLSIIVNYKDTISNLEEAYGSYVKGEYTDYKRRVFRDKLITALPEYIKTRIFSSLENKDNIGYVRYKLLHNSSPDNLARKIEEIQKAMFKNPDHPLNKEKTFFSTLNTKSVKNDDKGDYSVIQFNAGKIPVNAKNNIKAHLITFYNNPISLPEAGPEYTTKNLIDDLFDYSIVTGANSGAFKFFDYLPSELLLRDYSKAEREFSFPDNTDTQKLLTNILLNNPDLIPSFKYTDQIPIHYRGKLAKTYKGQIYYTKLESSSIEGENGKMEPTSKRVNKKLFDISDGSKIKQYDIEFNPWKGVYTHGYNILSSANYGSDVKKPDANPLKNVSSSEKRKINEKALNALLNDTSDFKLESRFEIGQQIPDKELEAIYNELMEDTYVQETEVVFVDLIEDNENNYAKYDAIREVIYVSKKALMDGKYTLQEILVHEYTHVAMNSTISLYENIKTGRLNKNLMPDDIYKKMSFLDSVYNSYRKENPGTVASQNLDEFISEFRRSADVRNAVKNLSPDKRGFLLKILDTIKDIIKHILGVSKDPVYDATVDFISTLSKNKVFVYSNGIDNYTVILSDNNPISIVKNNEAVVDIDQVFEQLETDPDFEIYDVTDGRLNNFYNENILQTRPQSYYLSNTELSKLISQTYSQIKNQDYTDDDIGNILAKRYKELVYQASVKNSILSKSTDQDAVRKAYSALKIIEKDIAKIVDILDKFAMQKSIYERIEYVDDLLDAVEETLDNKDADPIEVVTANDILSKLTEGFSNTNQDVNIYSSDKTNDLIFLSKEAENYPEILAKHTDQTRRVILLNEKLSVRTHETITKELKKKDPNIKTDFDSKAIKEDIGFYNKWFMTADRTGDDYMNYYMYLANEVNADMNLEISLKFEKLKGIIDKITPKLVNHYSKLLPNSAAYLHYIKYGIYSIFLDEKGNFKQRISSEYFNKRDKHYKKFMNLYKSEGYSQDTAAAKKEYLKFLENNTYTSLTAIQKDIDKEKDPFKKQQLEKIYSQFEHDRELKLGKFEVDFKIFSENLEEKEEILLDINGNPIIENGTFVMANKNKEDQMLEFIEEFYPFETEKELSDYVNNVIGKKYHYEVSGSVVSRWNISRKKEYTRRYKSFDYRANIPKPEHWNDMSHIMDPDMEEFYNAYVDTFYEIKENLPKGHAKELKLSDILFVARDVLNFSLKDLLLSKEARNTVLAGYVSRLTMKENHLTVDVNEKEYNDNVVNTRFGKTNAFNKNKAIKERLVPRLLQVGLPIYDHKGRINPFAANKTKGVHNPKFLRVKSEIEAEITEELSSLKSYDLGMVLQLYFIQAMQYKHKMNDINTMNLIKDAALKKYNSVKDSKGLSTPLSDKIQMLVDQDKLLKGIPNRKLLPDMALLKFVSKKYNPLEKKIKKDLEISIAELTKKLKELNAIKNKTELDLNKIKNTKKIIAGKQEQLDNLGAYLYVGNMLRELNSYFIKIMLSFSPLSAVSNITAGLIQNRLEAADGRIFTKETHDRIYKKIYFNSSISPFLVGTAAGILTAIPGGLVTGALGALVGYGINRFMQKRTNDPETTSILNFMGMYDILQENFREQELSNYADKSSRTYKSKLMRSDAAEILRQPMMFITKSEIPHQATIVGSVLDSVVILDPDDLKKETTLLKYLTRSGSKGLEFDVDYNRPMYLKLNMKKGAKIVETPLKFLMNRAATTSAAIAAKNHGNYRTNVKQAVKLHDFFFLSATFKTWAFENFYTRYEDEKVNRTISENLTSTPYQRADEDYRTKGMYVTSIERLGTPITFAMTMFNPGIKAMLAGFIAASSASTMGAIGAMIAPVLTVVGGSYILYDLKNKGYEQTVNTNVQKAFGYALAQRVLSLPFKGDMIKKFSEITINGATVPPQKYLDSVLSPVDSANLRKIIEQTAILFYLSMFYYSSLVAKMMLMGDDDDDESNKLVRKYSNFALNTVGRTMLDIESYTNPGDIWQKYGSIEKVAPTLTLPINAFDAASSLATFETYKRKTGIYEKGDLKFWKKIGKVLPGFSAARSFSTRTEQELQMFQNK